MTAFLLLALAVLCFAAALAYVSYQLGALFATRRLLAVFKADVDGQR